MARPDNKFFIFRQHDTIICPDRQPDLTRISKPRATHTGGGGFSPGQKTRSLLLLWTWGGGVRGGGSRLIDGISISGAGKGAFFYFQEGSIIVRRCVYFYWNLRHFRIGRRDFACPFEGKKFQEGRRGRWLLVH